MVSFLSCFDESYEDSETFVDNVCFENAIFSNCTAFLQCHHGFSIARHTNEEIYAEELMLYHGFGLFLK